MSWEVQLGLPNKWRSFPGCENSELHSDLTLNIYSNSDETLPTIFAPCVDNFGIKYLQKDHADHLINALRSNYTISINWEGKNYCGLEFDWNYSKHYVILSMPKYILSALHKFQHPKPARPQDAPHVHLRPDYGTKIQYAREDNSTALSPDDKRVVQSILSTLLYYARAIDSTMLPALNELASKQASPTEEILHACRRLLDYAATSHEHLLHTCSSPHLHSSQFIYAY